MSDIIKRLAGKVAAPKPSAIGKSWEQSGRVAADSSRARTRDVAREGTVLDVTRQALEAPVAKIGNEVFITDVGNMILQQITTGNLGSRTIDLYQGLSPDQKATVDALIVAQYPNAQAIGRGDQGGAVSPIAQEIFGLLQGKPISPERAATLADVARTEDSPILYQGRKFTAPTDVTPGIPAPDDALPASASESTEVSLIKDGVKSQLRSEGLKIGSAQYNSELSRRTKEILANANQTTSRQFRTPETDPRFRGPNPEITVPEGGIVSRALTEDQRKAFRQAFLDDYVMRREQYRRILSADADAQSGRGARSNGPKKVPAGFQGPAAESGMGPRQGEVARRNYTQDARVDDAVRNKFPDLSTAEVDSMVDDMWQQEQATRSVDSDRSKWAVPQGDALRMNILSRAAEEGADPITAKERRILATAEGESAGSKTSQPSTTSADSGEGSEDQSLVRSFREVLGFSPDMSAAEFNSSKSGGRIAPDKQPGNINTMSRSGRGGSGELMIEDDTPTLDTGRVDDEFNEESLVEAGMDRAAMERTGKPKKSRGAASGTLESMSVRSLDELVRKAIQKYVPADAKVVAGKAPASYGFRDPDELANFIIDVVNKNGEIVNQNMRGTVSARLNELITGRWGSDLSLSALPTKGGKPVASVTQRVDASNAQERIAAFKARQATQASTSPGTEGVDVDARNAAFEAKTEGMAKEFEQAGPDVETLPGGQVFPRPRLQPFNSSDPATAAMLERVALGSPPVPSRAPSPPPQVHPLSAQGQAQGMAVPDATKPGRTIDLYEPDGGETESPLRKFFRNNAGAQQPAGAPPQVSPTQVGVPDDSVVDSADDANRALQEDAAEQADAQNAPQGGGQQVAQPARTPVVKGEKPPVSQQVLADQKRHLKALQTLSPEDPRFTDAIQWLTDLKQNRARLATQSGDGPAKAVAWIDANLLSPMETAVQARRANPSGAPNKGANPGKPPRVAAAQPKPAPLSNETIRRYITETGDRPPQPVRGKSGNAQTQEWMDRVRAWEQSQSGDLNTSTTTPPEKIDGTSTANIDQEGAGTVVIDDGSTAAGTAPSTPKPPPVPPVDNQGFNRPPPPKPQRQVPPMETARAVSIFRSRVGRYPNSIEMQQINQALAEGGTLAPPVDVDLGTPGAPIPPHRLPREQLQEEYVDARDRLKPQVYPPDDMPVPTARSADQRAASNADAQKAASDKESDKAAAQGQKEAAAVDQQNAAKQGESGTAASTQKPGMSLGGAMSGVGNALYGATYPLRHPIGAAARAVGASRRIAVPAAVLGATAVGLNAYKDPILDTLDPFLPDDWDQPIRDGLQGASDAVTSVAGQAWDRAADTVEPYIQDFQDPTQPVPSDAPGIPGLPVGVSPAMQGPIPVGANINTSSRSMSPGGMQPAGQYEDDSIRRIRQVISSTRPSGRYGLNRPTPYYGL